MNHLGILELAPGERNRVAVRRDLGLPIGALLVGGGLRQPGVFAALHRDEQ
jgi:hypothetical protein